MLILDQIGTQHKRENKAKKKLVVFSLSLV